MRRAFLLIALPFVSLHPAHAALQSASDFLASRPSTPARPWVEPTPTPLPQQARVWKWQVGKYRAALPTQTSDQTAAAWLELSKLRTEVPRYDAKGAKLRPARSDLVQELPGPETWRSLQAGAKAAFETDVSDNSAADWYFFSRLLNDGPSQVEALRALYRLKTPSLAEALVKSTLEAGASRDSQNYRDEQKRKAKLGEFAALGSLMQESPDVAQQVEGFKLRLKVAAFNPRIAVTVPGLVELLGEEAATPLVREVVLSGATYNWPDSEKTAALVRKLWYDDPEIHAKAITNLPMSRETWKFWLDMENSPAGKAAIADDDSMAEYINQTILNGMLADSRYEDADNVLDGWMKGGVDINRVRVPYIDQDLPRSEQIKQLKWIESAQFRNPALEWWSQIGADSFRLGVGSEFIAKLKTLLGTEEFKLWPAKRRHSLISTLSRLNLAVGNDVAGGSQLLDALNVATDLKDVSLIQNDVSALLGLTRLKSNSKYFQAALAGARQAMLLPTRQNPDGTSAEKERLMLALRFAAQGESDFAQQFLISALSPKKPESDSANDDGMNDGSSNLVLLYGLMILYKQANQPADMVELLEKANGWGESELTPLLTYTAKREYGYEQDTPENRALPKLGYLAAWALAKTGRGAEALQVTKALIERDGGNDSAYLLLCQILGEKALPFLQERQKSDIYEERPLIWQAYLARVGKRYSEAEGLARQAIAIDPSDGEQGPGDRLRAYSELAATLKAEVKRRKPTKWLPPWAPFGWRSMPISCGLPG